MKNIYKGQDDIFYVINIKNDKDEQILPSDLNTFSIKAYTTDVSTAVSFTADDVADDVLYIPSQKIKDLKDGALKLRFHIGLTDTNYPDNSFDVTQERLTGYFLKSK